MLRNSNLGIAPGAHRFGRFFNSISSARNEEAVPRTGGTASERGSLGRDEPASIGSEVGALKPHCFGIEVNECLALKKKNRAEQGPTRFLRHTNISDTNRRTHQAARNRGRSRFTTFVSKTGFRQRTLRPLLDLSPFSTGELTKNLTGGASAVLSQQESYCRGEKRSTASATRFRFTNETAL